MTDDELPEGFEVAEEGLPEGFSAVSDAQPTHPLARLGDAVVEGGKGILKGAGDTAQGAGKLVNSATSVLADLFGRQAWAKSAGKGPVSGGISDAIMPGAIQGEIPELKAENDAQKVGKVIESLAEAVGTGGGGVLAQGGKAALLAATKEGKISPSALAAAAVAAGTAGAGKLALRGSEVLNAGLTAKAIRGLRTALNKEELPLVEAGASSLGEKLTDAAIRAGGGAALGGFMGGKKGAVTGAATAAGFPALSKAGLTQFMKTNAGQRILASVLAKMGALGESAAPVAGATLGRALARLRDQTGTTSTLYARDER